MGHNVTIVCPFERRTKQQTKIKVNNNVTILGVKTFNITKSNFFEKGIATLLIEYQFERAINRQIGDKKFDLILYTTPPITFNSLITKLKKKFGGSTYLMLKDIFPQNAVDLGLIASNGFLYKFFKRKEHQLYEISDFIGCMSPANRDYLLKHNPSVNSSKVEICPNAIMLVNREYKVSKEEIFDKYKIPKSVPVLIFGGNLGVAQGVDFLIEVLSSNNTREDCFFLVVGNGNAFSKLANWFELNIPQNALLIPSLPRLDYDVLESYCDVGMVFLDKRFSVPNFPSRILACMECKIPLLLATDVNTDVGNIAMLNEFGLWSLAGDIDRFNFQLNYMIKNKTIRILMGKKGYQYLSENYTVANVYNIITSHFISV